MRLPKSYNYIAAFLTFRCNLKCSYCINTHALDRNYLVNGGELDGGGWITALNSIPATQQLPITLQGGEPTLHPNFYEIVNKVRKPMDLLTNLQFDVDEFMANVPREKFKREAPYASIRVSYHPEQMDFNETVVKVMRLQNNGYQVGVYMIDLPEQENQNIIGRWSFVADRYNIDFRTKSLLGEYKGKMYGEFKYKGAVEGKAEMPYNNCFCRTSELLIAPDGTIHRCHSDLYHNRFGIGKITDKNFKPDRKWRPCNYFGTCNACDIKVTNNRFQQFGHTSVEIRA